MVSCLRRPSKPVAITVTRIGSIIESSMTAPKMMFASGDAAVCDDLGGLVDLEQPEVAAAGDREQHALRALDARLEQRAGDRRLRGVVRAVVAGGQADAHERRAGVLHDRANVGEVQVDQARAP